MYPVAAAALSNHKGVTPSICNVTTDYGQCTTRPFSTWEAVRRTVLSGMGQSRVLRSASTRVMERVSD